MLVSYSTTRTTVCWCPTCWCPR